MICGIGIDLVSLDKIRAICCKNKHLLKDNLFSERELGDARVDESDEPLTDLQISQLASKFAAKEAAVKAIGLPHDVTFDWSDIVVHGKENVSVEVFGNIQTFVDQAGLLRLNGSVSTSNSHSLAIIIGESE
jgi:phosphopantetheine--protein transferase-like protein